MDGIVSYSGSKNKLTTNPINPPNTAPVKIVARYVPSPAERIPGCASNYIAAPKRTPVPISAPQPMVGQVTDLPAIFIESILFTKILNL